MYEATQLSLDRRVALRVIAAERFATASDLARFDDEQRRAASIHDPALVPAYEAGDWQGGRFVATRLIRGRTLAQLAAEDASPGGRALASVHRALEAAHAGGLVHGRVNARNVLVDSGGDVHLADLALARGGTTRDDLAALSELSAAFSVTRRRRSTWGRVTAGLVAAAGALALALVVAGRDAEPAVPSAPPGTESLGAELATGALEPLGCSSDPGPNTPACTLSQARLAGTPPTVTGDGVVRSWVVAGASGEVSLQVLRTRGGSSFVAGFSQPQVVATTEPAAFPAELSVREGDRIAVRLGPGATIGSSPDEPAAVVERWDGGLTATPLPVDGVVAATELMLRADIEPGVRPEGPRQLVGRRAAHAADGRRLGDLTVALRAGGGGRVEAIALANEIAIDLFRGDRRVARLAVPDADPSGSYVQLTQGCGPVGASGFCLRWQNPGEAIALQHAYVVRRDGRIRLIG